MMEREKELSYIIEADRSEVAQALTKIKQAIASRSWLIEGRGSYAYDDDQYRREFADALDEIEASLAPLQRLAIDWSDCPTNSHEINEARRQRAEKNFKNI